MNLYQQPQWEKVPEKGKQTQTGSYLRLPVYRVKGDPNARDSKNDKPILTSSINYANQSSTQTGW